MVVSVYEQIWYHTHRESLSNLHLHALFLRYVDNRLVFLPPKIYLLFRFWSIHIFTKFRSFWKLNRIKNFWDFKLNLIRLSYVINHHRTCPRFFHRCQPHLQRFFSVDLLPGAPLSTEDLFHSHRLTRKFIY